MRKSLSLLVLLSCVAGSSVVFAATGSTPGCASGALNLVIVNKDLSECDPQHPDICLYDEEVAGDTLNSCSSGAVGLALNSNVSFSFHKKPKRASIAYTAYVKGVTKSQRFYFSYDQGYASDNCAEIFGAYARCVITQSGDSEHPVYTLTMSKS